MSIRSTAKALIISGGKILLNKCYDDHNGAYYSLPGGGQQQYETLHEAVIRECLEETGYAVKPLALVCVCEEICLDAELRKKYPDYAHKLYHIFTCELTDDKPEKPTEKDDMQIGIEWIDIKSLTEITILPKLLGKQVTDVLNSAAPFFLGSERIDFNHG